MHPELSRSDDIHPAVADSKAPPEVSLDHKYTLTSGRVYLSGVQALIRLMLIQKWRDEHLGWRTAGFISGYRGSPLGGLDLALWKSKKHLQANHIVFQPGINEDLAATAVWGTQHVDLVSPSKVDGVFSLWYGKGPGVDRCGDVFKHANHSGTSRQGGVLLIAGDDHGGYSSTLPHQSDHQFIASMIPVLYPANVQEYIDLGLHGIAMSRYSGCLVAMKALSDTVESSASIDANPYRIDIKLPQDFHRPDGGLNARSSAGFISLEARAQEALMQDYKVYAALAYARANGLNRTIIDAPKAQLGIVAVGKSSMDVLEALEQLDINVDDCAKIGIRVFKVSMPWPLEPDSVRDFANGLEEILVVEEKRQIVEYQLKEQLYNWREDVRPRVIGKFDERGEWVHEHDNWLLTSKIDFSVAQIAKVIASRIERFYTSERIRGRLSLIAEKEKMQSEKQRDLPVRRAWYCAGCPHNTSTRVPSQSVALAGIGCHVMATSIYPQGTKTVTHMGGEGATWIGQAPFAERQHLFVNLGDGTFFHSGSLAIRAAIAAKVNCTYKILFNSAVAMTGGQPIDGELSVGKVVRLLMAEGVQNIAIVADDPHRHRRQDYPSGVRLAHRQQMLSIQEAFTKIPGVSAIIYDQYCAAEKRRITKRQKLPEKQFVVINESVCEGCGDCGVQSNCVAIIPAPADPLIPAIHKRQIDQSSCNHDYSCVKGFCPSFITLRGQRKKPPLPELHRDLPEPQALDWDHREHPFNLLINGIGGTGVITIGALIGMAAHIDGRGISVLDMTGLAQKNATVFSHVRIGKSPDSIRAQRIATGEADAIIGGDLLSSAHLETIHKTQKQRTLAIINRHEQPTGDFAQNRDWQFPTNAACQAITNAVATAIFIDANRFSVALTGDTVCANAFLLGLAWQAGAVPVSLQAIKQAIELNAVAVAMNWSAFNWGRAAFVDRDWVFSQVPDSAPIQIEPIKLESLIEQQSAALAQYGGEALRQSFQSLVAQTQQWESQIDRAVRTLVGETLTEFPLTQDLAQSLMILWRVKDEFEVAKMHTDGRLHKQLAKNFESGYALTYHLNIPWIGGLASDGRPKKYAIPARYADILFALLRATRKVRHTRWNPFAYQRERREEKEFAEKFVRLFKEKITAPPNEANYRQVHSFVRTIHQIRGYGVVRQKAREAIQKGYIEPAMNT